MASIDAPMQPSAKSSSDSQLTHSHNGSSSQREKSLLVRPRPSKQLFALGLSQMMARESERVPSLIAAGTAVMDAGMFASLSRRPWRRHLAFVIERKVSHDGSRADCRVRDARGW